MYEINVMRLNGIRVSWYILFNRMAVAANDFLLYCYNYFTIEDNYLLIPWKGTFDLLKKLDLEMTLKISVKIKVSNS